MLVFIIIWLICVDTIFLVEDDEIELLVGADFTGKSCWGMDQSQEMGNTQGLNPGQGSVYCWGQPFKQTHYKTSYKLIDDVAKCSNSDSTFMRDKADDTSMDSRVLELGDLVENLI